MSNYEHSAITTISSKLVANDLLNTPNTAMHPIIADYLSSIQISDSAGAELFLSRTNPFVLDPFTLKDVEKAIIAILDGIKAKKRFLVFGDYDCDGITSTIMMYKTLANLGANVDHFIPSRAQGYGMSEKSIAYITEHCEFDIIITVDNGITAKEPVETLVDMGYDVIVTDHHSYDAERYPDSALAVVNPSHPDCEFTFSDICGCAVAFYLSEAIRLYILENKNTYRKWSKQLKDQETIVEGAYQLLAIATVADVMPLNHLVNRFLVWKGLCSIRERPLLGIRALCEAPADWPTDWQTLTAVDIAFNIAPPINAAGRIDVPHHGLYLLLSDNEADAFVHAKKLLSLNSVRKDLQRTHAEIAEQALLDQGTDISDLPIIFAPVAHNTPHGIVGLIATTLVKKYNRPALVYVVNDQEGTARGSARSVPGYNIVESLSLCADKMLGYGGHSGAAGFNFKLEDETSIKAIMQSHAAETVDFSALDLSDVEVISEIPVSAISRTILDIHSRLEPFGIGGMPRLSFVTRNVKVLNSEAWGRTKKHARFEISDVNGNRQKVNSWNTGDNVPESNSMIDIAYTVEWATWPMQHLRLSLIYWHYNMEDEQHGLSKLAENISGGVFRAFARNRKRLVNTRTKSFLDTYKAKRRV